LSRKKLDERKLWPLISPESEQEREIHSAFGFSQSLAWGTPEKDAAEKV